MLPAKDSEFRLQIIQFRTPLLVNVTLGPQFTNVGLELVACQNDVSAHVLQLLTLDLITRIKSK